MSKGVLRPKEAGQVLLHGADAGDTKGVHQQLGHAGAEESGKGGARWMFFTPRESRARSTMTAFCSYQAML